MNSKFAFNILKVLEMYALSKQEDIQHPVNNYDLIFLIPSSHYNASPGWTLLVQPNSEWLLKNGSSNAFMELIEIFKEKKLRDFSSDNYIRTMMFFNEKDDVTRRLKRFNYTFENDFKYFDRVSNIEFRDEQYDEMYILKSRILDKIQFGKKIQFLQRQYDSYNSAYFNFNLNADAIAEHIIIGVDDYNLLALNEKGIKKYDINTPLNKQQALITDEFTDKISLYDVFDVMPNAILSKSAA